jgi:outer membrane biosynthesis protein TonB
VQERVVVRFLVKVDGTIDRVRRLTDLRAKRELADLIDWQVESAIRACAFEPGRDPDGKPQEVWLILTLHLSPSG